ncbi:MAG: hypothetical protein ABI823_02300 [Bryobacteraceae bacterium]
MSLWLTLHAVSWAMQPDLFPILDEIGNPSRFLNGVEWKEITVLPSAAYNDRPVGFALERLWFDAFGFAYLPQLVCLLAIHAANLALGFLLFRRLGVSVLLSIAGLCVFGSLSTTVQTVTYLGAIFDVVCLFFLLASIVVILHPKPWAYPLSALLFLLALRSKEFAIVVPVLLIGIGLKDRVPILSIVKRLWIHLAIWVIFLVKYLLLIGRMMSNLAPANPYFIRADPKTIMESFSYYTALIFAADENSRKTYVVVGCIVVGAVFAVYRRNRSALWAFAAYILMLLPVSIIPGARSPFYTYAAQLFLLLGIALIVDDVVELLVRQRPLPWRVSAAIATLVLAALALFHRSDYFQDRVNFTLRIRKISAVTGADAARLMPMLTPDSWIFVNHAENTPWLLVPGPCAYFDLLARRRSFHCVLGTSQRELSPAYESHLPPKYYLVYGRDGSLRTADFKQRLEAK